ncbi:uncharacterized protein LOC127290614, partial [Leptopilina boulardi]|uniref:uncharacterized protein LOC127290614 n=1 Tax=Leptopilina boulardi TaxID=63433 RepID=UPI0021F5C415
MIVLVQREEFQDEIERIRKKETVSKTSKLRRLNPLIKNGLLRVGGRIRHADLEHNKKCPILLPGKHPFTDLLIRHTHEKQLHAGINATLYALRLNYWPVDGRSSVKKIVHNCVKCFRAKPRDVNYIMGNLPK